MLGRRSLGLLAIGVVLASLSALAGLRPALRDAAAQLETVVGADAGQLQAGAAAAVRAAAAATATADAAATASYPTAVTAADAAGPPPAVVRTRCANGTKVVIWKLDDFKSIRHHRWPELLEWSTANGHAMTVGAVGSALEPKRVDAAMRAWMQKMSRTGLVEFWDHGFFHAPDEFLRSVDNQLNSMNRTYHNLRALGFNATAFGAPFNHVNARTVRALAGMPQYKVWLLNRNKEHLGPDSKKAVIMLSGMAGCWAEKTTSVMSPVGPLLANCTTEHARAPHVPLLLQAHPRGFDDTSMARFKAAVSGMAALGFVSCTISQYLGLA